MRDLNGQKEMLKTAKLSLPKPTEKNINSSIKDYKFDVVAKLFVFFCLPNSDRLLLITQFNLRAKPFTITGWSVA